jgi:hypothetical protein
VPAPTSATSTLGMAAMNLEFHALATLFPLLDGAGFDELVADIRTHGLREPIVLFEGKVLDGRNIAPASRPAWSRH